MCVTQPGLETHAVIVDVSPGGGGGVVLAALRGGGVGPPAAAAVRRGRGDGCRVGVDVHQEAVLIPKPETANRSMSHFFHPSRIKLRPEIHSVSCLAQFLDWVSWDL